MKSTHAVESFISEMEHCMELAVIAEVICCNSDGIGLAEHAEGPSPTLLAQRVFGEL